MKTELTPAEFRRLIHLVYIATWILDAHKTGEDPDTAPYRQSDALCFYPTPASPDTTRRRKP